MKLKLIDGNAITLLQSGAQFFPALLTAIAQAQHSVYLETYIYYDDVIGQRVSTALATAAQRGVTVRVVIDGFGSKKFSPKLRTQLEQAGVELRVFHPEHRLWNFSLQRLQRLHRKLVLIDHRLAFVGGINILDDFSDPVHGVLLNAARFDFCLQVQGPLVRAIATTMVRLWARLNWRSGAKVVNLANELLAIRRGKFTADGQTGGHLVKAAFVVRDHLRHRRTIERAYLSAIGRAHGEIMIANAYFFPGWRLRRALIRAAMRGVRVCLLLQGQTEYYLAHHATQALYADFLAARIEIYEYQRSYLHAKVAVIDQNWVTVGSSNLDPFSLLLAREANVVVDDQVFAAQLRSSINHAMHHEALLVHASQRAKRAWWVRAYDWFAYGILRLGVLVAGRRHY